MLEDFLSEVLPANFCVRGVAESQLGVVGTTYVTLRLGNIIFLHQLFGVKDYHSFPGHLLSGLDFLYHVM